MSAWLAVILAGVGSYAFRLGAVVLIDRFALPPWFERTSTYVMPAVFAGLVVGSLAVPLTDGGDTALPVLAGAVVTAGTAHRRSAATAVFAGMAVLTLVRLAVSAG